MFSTIFGKYLQDNKITAYKVAKETGISQGLISDYKNGTKKPSTENLVKIADYLDCSTDFLLGRTSAPLNEPEEEHRLIQAYRKLTEDGKKAILTTAELYATSPQYQKYTNIPKEA